MSDLDRAFGTYIGVIRRAKKLSLREVARMVGMDHTHLCKVERGKMPPPGTEKVEKIADALGLDRFKLELMAGRLPGRLRELMFDDDNARNFMADMANNLTTYGWAELVNMLDGWAEDAALMEDEAP